MSNRPNLREMNEWTFTPHPLAAPVPKYEPRTGPALKFIDADDPNHYLNVRRALLAAADLTEAQMFAMMNCSASHRHQAIWHHARLNIFEYPPFTLSTFRELRERGYAEKPDNAKYHRLTQGAFDLAQAVADELVRKHKIHAPILVHSRGERTKHVNFNCTCGWGCALTAGSKMQAKASRAFTSHLRSINAVAAMADSIAHTTRRQGAEEG